MLSEADHRKLKVIEEQLRSDDPAFVERLAGNRHRRFRLGRDGLPSALLLLAAAGGGVGLAAGQVAAVVTALIVADATVALWAAADRRAGD